MTSDDRSRDFENGLAPRLEVVPELKGEERDRYALENGIYTSEQLEALKRIERIVEKEETSSYSDKFGKWLQLRLANSKQFRVMQCKDGIVQIDNRCLNEQYESQAFLAPIFMVKDYLNCLVEKLFPVDVEKAQERYRRIGRQIDFDLG